MTARIVVCGSGFGSYTARGVAAADDLELVAVLGRGSAATQRLAAEVGVRAVDRVDDLTGPVDLAHVAVPGGVLGGHGTELAREFLRRGTSVLQEQPVHPDEVAELLALARRHGGQYRVSTFHRHTRALDRFLRLAGDLATAHRVVAVEASAGTQLLQPVLDVVTRAVGRTRPWSTTGVLGVGGFRLLTADLGGVAVSLRVQHQLDPADGDNGAAPWLRAALTLDAGVLGLSDVHGPVTWSPRLHVARDGAGRLDVSATVPPGPATGVLGPVVVPSWAEVFGRDWPAAGAAGVREVLRDAAAGLDPLRAGAGDLAVAGTWRETSVLLGRPDLVRVSTPPSVDPARLEALA
ncbi:Gfo/Idh/MocA family oxidoreductase [Kineococcus sp. TBRC 1896]|uniref:Gfo/Idh/MocA family oxidoreductase n=1 Tax=Kineococcus mangrovi TaxID=1660183 RepID=A0ABV4I070_9ACTN